MDEGRGMRGLDGGEVPVATDVYRRGGWAGQEEKPSKISRGRDADEDLSSWEMTTGHAARTASSV